MKKIGLVSLLTLVIFFGNTYAKCDTSDLSNCSKDSEPTICTMEYAPVCAEVQVQCIKAPCPAIKETFGNKCMMNANKLANFLYEGECKEEQTDTDLSGCKSYFDGCNNCSVVDGKLNACTKMYCQNPSKPKCLKYKEPEINMPNPASKFCVENSGNLEIIDGTGGQYGICKFKDGSKCEEWHFFRGECKPEYKKIQGVFDKYFEKYSNKFQKLEDRKIVLENFKMKLQSFSQGAKIGLKRTYNKIINAIELYFE